MSSETKPCNISKRFKKSVLFDIQIAGYIIVVVTFALQAPARWAAARLHGTPRLLLADVYHLISFVATVNVWRGIWGLLDVYFFPGELEKLILLLHYYRVLLESSY